MAAKKCRTRLYIDYIIFFTLLGHAKSEMKVPYQVPKPEEVYLKPEESVLKPEEVNVYPGFFFFFAPCLSLQPIMLCLFSSVLKPAYSYFWYEFPRSQQTTTVCKKKKRCIAAKTVILNEIQLLQSYYYYPMYNQTVAKDVACEA